MAHSNATGEPDRLLGISEQAQPGRVFDPVVVGAGPTGLSAAICAARKNRSVAIVSLDIGGQLGTTADIELPGVASVSGPDLVARGTPGVFR